MNELEQMLTDSAERLFGNEVTLEQSEAMERGEFPQSLWNAVDKSGLVHVLASEDPVAPTRAGRKRCR